MGGLGVLLAILLYGGGAWKFWNGFNRTTYSQSKLVLTLFWPLLLANSSYRDNFKKALKR